jgi:hypothetical protein
LHGIVSETFDSSRDSHQTSLLLVNYLEQLTYGEANRVVSGNSHLSGERAYDASMMALKDRYGDTDVIASAFIKKGFPSNFITSGVGFLKCLIIASIHVA